MENQLDLFGLNTTDVRKKIQPATCEKSLNKIDLKAIDKASKISLKDVFRVFEIEDLQDFPTAVHRLLEKEIAERNQVYCELLELNGFDLSYDWFQNIYEDELAQRGQKKQDFTPNQVGVILSKITDTKPGKIYEPTAGNGSLLIANWWQRCLRYKFPYMHRPSQHMFECWELSNRSIPILLLNLSIRGMMGVVYHGDVLTQEIKCKYILLNRDDNTLGFSEIIKDENFNLKIVQNDNIKRNI